MLIYTTNIVDNLFFHYFSNEIMLAIIRSVELGLQIIFFFLLKNKSHKYKIYIMIFMEIINSAI